MAGSAGKGGGNFAKYAKAQSINIKPSHVGLLHKSLGVKQGAKISSKALTKAAASSNPTLAKRAQFAINAAKWKH